MPAFFSPISASTHSLSTGLTRPRFSGDGAGASSSSSKKSRVERDKEPLENLFFHPGIYEPLLAHHGSQLLKQATWDYIKAESPDRRIDAALWIKQLLGKGDVDPGKPASEIPVVNLAINSRKPWLVKLFQRFGVSFSPPEVLSNAREKLSEIAGEENPEVRGALLNRNQGVFLLPGLDLTQPLPSANAPQTFMHIAARDNELALLKPLLQSAVPPDLTAGNKTPLEEAVNENAIMAGEELIKAGANIDRLNRSGNTPLMQALQRYHNGFAKMLIRNGANPNIPNPVGVTPLHLAASHSFGNTGLLSELLKAGANVNAQNLSKSAPLHEAARRGLANAVSQLLQAEADANITDIHGRNPVFQAAGCISPNAPQALKELLAYGADPNQPDNKGETPLLYAIKKRRAKNVQALVEGAQKANGELNAANINLAGRNNQKPLKLAQDLALHDMLMPEVIRQERGHNDSGLVRMQNGRSSVIRKRKQAIEEMIMTMSGRVQRDWQQRVRHQDEIVQHLLSRRSIIPRNGDPD